MENIELEYIFVYNDNDNDNIYCANTSTMNGHGRHIKVICNLQKAMRFKVLEQW